MQAESVDFVKFGLFSPDQIRKLSVAKLTVPDTYNEDGYPIDGGLLDQRLGVIDPGLICKTCGARAKVCPGHFGHIELVRPVVHSEFSKVIYLLLQSTCQKCRRVLFDVDSETELAEKVKSVVEAELDTEKTGEEQSGEERVALFKKLKSIKKCPHCGEVQQKVRFEAPSYFYIGGTRMKPDEVKDMLEKVSNDDLRVMGVDPITSRPEYLVISALLVPPVNVRPSITLESGERSEDDLTHKLVDIMRINQRLEQNINAGAPQIIIDDLRELLQYHVTTYFNNEPTGMPPARHSSGRALKTLAQRLKGKEGRFRYNLSGKRVNYSARTVISVDPFLDVDEVGVPKIIAEKLTVPFYITEWNLAKAKELLKRTEYPIVMGIITKEKLRKRITDVNKEEILNALKAGDILERQITNGDIALFNRQPSLHRVSIMAHRIKIVPGRTFRINFCTTSPYNADFDGDEMNLHIPQTLEAQAEAKYLMQVQDQVFSPKNGEAIISNSEDGVTGAYLLTNDDTMLNKEDAIYLLTTAGIFELPEHEKNGMYSGKDVFSMLFPKKLNFDYKMRDGKYLRIKNGRMTDGIMKKETFGGGNLLLAKIALDFGNEVLKEFISKSARMSYAYAYLCGINVGVKEYTIPHAAKTEKDKLVAKAIENVAALVTKYKSRKLEAMVGYTLRKTLERMIIAELDHSRHLANQLMEEYMDKSNHAVMMAKAGSRGNTSNFVQMSIFLGQQATISGGRIRKSYMTNRVLPHLKPGDIGAVARGFAISNCYDGFDPIDMFMYSIGSRASMIYKGMLTAKSGYLQRRLINALQDYQVEEDFTVRDVHGNLIQTLYGGDKIDPVKVELAEVSKE